VTRERRAHEPFYDDSADAIADLEEDRPLRPWFGDLAHYLADAGYEPVPIRPGHKAPMLADWQVPQAPSYYLPHRDPDTGKVTDCCRWGIGLLAARTPAVDLDIRDREVVRVLFRLTGEILGPAPFRIGARPKVLLPYHSDSPFAKITGKWFALPGENWRSESYTPHRVEVIGAGQQFVGYAIHPGTRRSYRWARGEPLQIQQADLTEITAARTYDFVAIAERTAQELGATRVHKIEGRWTPVPWLEPERQAAVRHHYAGEHLDSSWRQLQPETLAKLIDAKHARRTREGWISSCPAHTSQGHRSLHITPRAGGGSVVHDFGGCDFIELAHAISAIVGRTAA
jgi:hypothetical protein